MTERTTVTIADQKYDSVTGLPLSKSEPAHHTDVKTSHASHTSEETKSHRQSAGASHSLHRKVQRSQTLRRKSLKKPIVKHPLVHASAHRQTSASTAANKHPQVTKFAPHPVGAIAPKKVMDIGPVAHPHVVKAHVQSHVKEHAQTVKKHPAASETKAMALATAIAQTPTHSTSDEKAVKSTRQRLRPRQQVAAILSATMVLVLMAGYLTYLNLPTLSVRVAAAQAGIDARYPDYHPDGYALSGPVTYTDGRVSMNFKANGGTQAFEINQSKSGWNNDAVLDNYVTPRAGSSYVPYNVQGLTIYTYEDDAAWVNGGILYTIEGDAPLSSDQIRRIATSLL